MTLKRGLAPEQAKVMSTPAPLSLQNAPPENRQGHGNGQVAAGGWAGLGVSNFSLWVKVSFRCCFIWMAYKRSGWVWRSLDIKREGTSVHCVDKNLAINTTSWKEAWKWPSGKQWYSYPHKPWKGFTNVLLTREAGSSISEGPLPWSQPARENHSWSYQKVTFFLISEGHRSLLEKGNKMT